ncbi:AraC family transcriptional regulator [Photobacterium angustum]|uniref:AraC family transcriptional regulator n=2 Tax=Photobacterium angustum TaxID=661 RepID=UPI0005DEF35E|nr:helix-turn-helix transcriptional regulator [Photobacterium angustum]KJG02597.1 AraC family transcriptional regulator [Photobacterium angustum]KJG33286.1 AraC family transcriptional regulator [Photobacterium angustum]PSV68443.1 AraC family transcriptional regulator [Photobacterium angustum]PSV95891.1 AraC family transcriptional regulator [Photobacterium angustum]PSW83116.1 AraC family transcriptional regulator [Photobacterium angustum]
MQYQSFDPNFDSDSYSQKAIGYILSGIEKKSETPIHSHKKCQLVLPLSGYVTCNVSDRVWMMTSNTAVWVPTETPHNIRISPGAKVCNLFIDPCIEGLPQQPVMLSISPLLRELITYLCHLDHQHSKIKETGRIIDVLIDQMVLMPTEQFDFPIPKEPRLHKIAESLLDDPSNRNTVGQWAIRFAMSERTLSRLVNQELGMSFARWRAQLHLILAFKKLSDGVPVQRISDDLGYESVSAFITFFKNKMGIPPKQYAKQQSSLNNL